MKLQELNKLNEFEKLSQLHEITKGYDKYLVAELLNNFYNETYYEITTKHKDITESITIDPSAMYLNGFHFKHFGFDSWNKFTITIKQHLFDFGNDISWYKPNEELKLCRDLFDSIIKLENVLSDKCLNEIEMIELTNCELIEIQNNKPSQKKNCNKKESNFFDFIHNVINKELFASELKDVFNSETGIDFKIMITLLKAEGIFSFTQFAPFFRSIDIYFDRDIGTQNGLNDLYKHSIDEQKYYADRITTIQNKLNMLITKHKIKK